MKSVVGLAIVQLLRRAWQVRIRPASLLVTYLDYDCLGADFSGSGGVCERSLERREEPAQGWD